MKNASDKDDSIMGVITSTFCDVRSNLNESYVVDKEEKEAIEQLQSVMASIMVCFCFVGICGNIMNIKTLQSPSLQTVPFMYIRTLAIFDLIGLCGVVINILSKLYFGNSYWVIAYKCHIEPVLINTFFIGGLYSAFMLTLERSLLIARPHYRQAKPRRAARIRIAVSWLTAFVLHIPLGLQFKPIPSPDGQGYTIGNNIELLCGEPMYTFFYYYKFIREGIRLATVLFMAFMNGIIAYKLQQTNKRRREMLCQRATTAAMLCSTASASARSSIAVTEARSFNYSTSGGAAGNNPSFSSASSSGGRPRPRAEETPRTSAVSTLYRSFTERKLTVLMAVICVIYMLGNLPQMIIMSVQDESKEGVWKFQVLRQVGNMLEVGNHCVNFYLFCLASSEYSRAFANSCGCFHKIAARVPILKRFAHTPYLTGASVVSINAPREMVTGIELGDMSNSSGGRKISTIPNEAALSASQEDNLRKVSSEQCTSSGVGCSSGLSTSNMVVRETDEEERKPLRGILVNSGRRLSSSLRSSGIRQKRSLTIANNEAETSMMRDVDDGIEKVEASV